MVTLTVAAALPGGGRGLRRAARALTAALARTAPPGCEVAAVVAADLADVVEGVPRLAEAEVLPEDSERVAAGWQRGHRSAVSDAVLLHTLSAAAPLRAHARPQQVSVTFQDTLPWLLRAHRGEDERTRIRAFAKRATRFADAVVVPTHAVAEELASFVDFGDRIRVLGWAPTLAPDAGSHRETELPEDRLVTTARPEPLEGLQPLLEAMTVPGMPESVVVAGPAADGPAVAALARAAGLSPEQVIHLADPDDDLLGAAMRGARAVVVPTLAGGSGLGLLDAMAVGAPVVHADVASLGELAGTAGIPVERGTATGAAGDASGYADRIAGAVIDLLRDPVRVDEQRVLAADRARVFGWDDSAERLWRLHADL